MSVILLIRKRTLLSAWLLICLGCLSAVFWSGSRQVSVPVSGAEQESGSAFRTVVIDPGHGGQDGGAVAPDGTEESGINLAISLRLEQLLRFAGVPTEMTRREDCMVCDPGLDTMRQRKVSDIRNRTALVNGIPNAVLLSIHQNSLPSSPANPRGAGLPKPGRRARNAGAASAMQPERGGQHPSGQGSKADPGEYLPDESCNRAGCAGGVWISFQRGGNPPVLGRRTIK